MIVSDALASIRKHVEKLFKSRPDGFIERLREQSFIVSLGTRALVDYMDSPNKKNRSRVYNLERKADESRHHLIQQLKNTFVTPIDREDLYSLSRAIDDVLDYAYSTTNEMDILNIAPNCSTRSMAELLHKGAEEIYQAITQLEHSPHHANLHALQVRALENQMENLYAETLVTLLKKPDNLEDVVNMMKLMEIYRHMFRAVRSTKQAADIIGDIIVKFY